MHLASFFFFLVLFWEESWQKPTALAIAGGSLVVSVWTITLGILGRLGIFGVIGGSFFGKEIGATFGNPNFLAGYLLVSLPFTIGVARRIRGTRWTRRTRWVGVIIQVLAIGLTFSRAAILGVILLGLGYLWGRTKKSTRVGILGALGVLGIFLIIFLNKELRVSGEKYFFPESRGRIIVRGLNAFVKKPIFGWGIANFDYAYESNFYPMRYEQDVYVDKAHSNLLEVLVTMGIVGFLIYSGIILGILGILGRLGREKTNFEKILLISFLLFLFHSQTNIISINEEIFFWMIAGIGFSLRKRMENDKIQ